MSSSSFQEPSLITLTLNTSDVSPFSFHYFVLSIFSLFIPTGTHLRKSATKSLCWEITYFPGITLQPKHAHLSFLLARTKSIWLECCPLLKVTRWVSLFLKKVLAIIKSKATTKSRTFSPSWFLLPYPKPPWTASKVPTCPSLIFYYAMMQLYYSLLCNTTFPMDSLQPLC